MMGARDLLRLAAAVGFAVLVCMVAPRGAGAAPSPIAAYYDFLHWTAMGRADLAIEQFASDAVVIAGPCTDADPCVGHAAIRERYFAALAAGRATLPLTGQYFDGRCLHTRGTARGDVAFDGQRIGWQAGHVFEFRAGRIASLRVEWELDSKPQSLRHVAGAAR